MKITSRFTVAVHVLLAIYILSKEHKMTPDFEVSSVNVSSVTLTKLKIAGMFDVKA